MAWMAVGTGGQQGPARAPKRVPGLSVQAKGLEAGAGLGAGALRHTLEQGIPPSEPHKRTSDQG